MTTRKEMIRAYKERKIPAGVFQIRNTSNGRILLGSGLNLEGVWNSQRFKLSLGTHPNRELQKEWNEGGSEAFLFEILQVVEEKDEPDFNLSDELALLEEIWLEKLSPFGEKGYNTDFRIRQR